MWCFLNKMWCFIHTIVMLQCRRKSKSCLICDAFLIKRDSFFIKLWCYSVEVATTSREEANDQDNEEENHDVEDEQPLSKMKGKRVKKTIASKKRK